MQEQNSTFPSVPTGKVNIKKASDCEIRGGCPIAFRKRNFIHFKVDFWFLYTVPSIHPSIFLPRGMNTSSFNAKLHRLTLNTGLYLCLSSIDIMIDLDSYYCFQSTSPSKVIGQNPKVVLGSHFVGGRSRAACRVNNNLVCVLQLLHNGHCVNLSWHGGASDFPF